MASLRKAFVMSVHAGQEQEYERRHQPIWKQLEDVLKSHGVSNYSIFLDPSTNHLFGYCEIESEQKWSEIAQSDICKEWWAHMKDLMPCHDDNSPKSAELKEVFHLD
jgi:L-rhamnose mutarotase